MQGYAIDVNPVKKFQNDFSDASVLTPIDPATMVIMNTKDVSTNVKTSNHAERSISIAPGEGKVICSLKCPKMIFEQISQMNDQFQVH